VSQPNPSRVIRVPPDLLETSLRELADSPRGYSRAELLDVARAIDDARRRLDRGTSPDDLLALRRSVLREERLAGEAYAAVFRGSNSTHPLRADLVGGRLIVDAGNHRIRAAQELGIRAVPVEVRARDTRALDRIEAASRLRIRQAGDRRRQVPPPLANRTERARRR
jgi:hypothetical protein